MLIFKYRSVSKQVNNETGQTASAEGVRQHHLITHAVLVGLTPLIPIPFVDDLVKGHLLRRMVRGLAGARGRSLTAEEVEMLTEDRGGCLKGCVAQVIIYPLKKIFRKIFFFLEWKRAVDLTSRTYHQGYLIDHALATHAGRPALFELKSVAEIRDAIEAVCREAPIKPLETAIGASFRKSKGALSRAVRLLEGTLRRKVARPDRQEVAAAVEAVEAEEEREIAGVTNGLQRAISNIPEEHFRQLRARLEERLGLTKK